MASVRKVEKLTVATQNVIPQLAEIPLNNVVMMVTAGASAIPLDEYTVSGKTITWDEVSAGYNLEVGEVVVVDYEYDDGTGVTPPYDSSDSTMNTVSMTYNLIVAEENIVPKLIHVPAAGTLVLTVNGNATVEGLDWVRSGKIVNWVSGTTLEVSDVVHVEYKPNV